MERHSVNREERIETKYLYKVWARVDSGIELPETLTGRALLPRLDNVEQPVPLTRKIQFSPKVFTWQSGVTYAAAFLLIVALSTVIGRGDRTRPEILEGQITITGESADTDLPQEPAVSAQILEPGISEGQQQPEQAHADAASQSESGGTPPQGENRPAETEAPDGRVYAGQDAAAATYEGIGGQSESVLLGQEGAYTYTYRANDPTDPDKDGYPFTVNIMDTETGELVCVIDIPGMLTIQDYILYEDELALVGLNDGGAVLQAYDLSVITEPVETLMHIQPGTLTDARLYKNVVHMVTLADDDSGLDCEVIPLEGATVDTVCVITAIDLDTKEINQKAFAGAGEDVALYNLNVYLNYTGEVTEENDTGRYGAHIRLEGIEIELNNA